MDQINQLTNNLRQARQTLNSAIGQVNQQLSNTEQIANTLGNQLVQQTGGNYGAQMGANYQTVQPSFRSQVIPNTGSSGSQYQGFRQANSFGNVYTSGKTDKDVGQSYYQSAGSQFAGARSQYNPTGIQSTMSGSQYGGTGVSSYSSGIKDEDVGQNYQSAQTGNLMASRSQYNAGSMSNLQSNRLSNNQYGPSSSMQSGVNQYGASYSSGMKDEEVGQNYYQSAQTGSQLASRSQYNPGSMSNLQSGAFSNNQYGPSSTMRTGAGTNQYGAYSSGIKDEDVGQSYT